MKINKVKDLIREAIELELDEMARVAKLIKVADEEKAQEFQEKFKGTWVGDLISAVIGAKDGITQNDLAIASGKTKQQDVNTYVRKFIESGAFSIGDHSKPLAPKNEPGGPKGRPATPEGKQRSAAKNLMKSFIANPDYEPTPAEVEFLGSELINNIKSVAVSGGPHKGRPIGSSSIAKKLTADDFTDPEDIEGEPINEVERLKKLANI